MSRRADRLFQIVQTLRGRRLTTAAQLAHRLEVSERTIYRDIRDLTLSGVPIEGEAGIGYRLHADFDAPPLMFTTGEIEALVAATRMLKAWGGTALGLSADTVCEKLIAALPQAKRSTAESLRIFAPGHMVRPNARDHFDIIHTALTQQRVLDITYVDAQMRNSQRTIQPLGLFFWGGPWLLAAWCETRSDYRNFRLDRCQNIRMLERRFTENPERSLSGFLRAVNADL